MAIPNLTQEQRAAFADLLASKDQDVLKEMLSSLVFDGKRPLRTVLRSTLAFAMMEKTCLPS